MTVMVSRTFKTTVMADRGRLATPSMVENMAFPVRTGAPDPFTTCRPTDYRSTRARTLVRTVGTLKMAAKTFAMVFVTVLVYTLVSMVSSGLMPPPMTSIV